MKGLIVMILLFPVLTQGQDKRDSVNYFLNCVKSMSLVEGYFSDYEKRYIDIGPKICEGLELDYSTALREKYESILHKNFVHYKEKINSLVFTHYFNLEQSQFDKSYVLCSQKMEIDEVRERSGYFDVMDSGLVQMQSWFDHDLPFLVEALLASEAPLRLVVFIGNDSISSTKNIDLQLTLILSDSESLDLLQNNNLEITTHTNLEYESIEYLELTYNGLVYEFFKPLLDASTLSIDPSLIIQVNTVGNDLTKDSFEEKLFWYLAISEKEISLKIKRTETVQIKTNANTK